nr:immunoglobulin heavy chain junction region [Macaca mulatta]
CWGRGVPIVDGPIDFW